MFRLACVAMGLMLALSACGSTAEERGLSGAGLGAAAGAVIGAVTGLSIVQGVVIGAAAGGLTGVLTDEDTVDLGAPVWKKDKPAVSGQQLGGREESDALRVRGIQQALVENGYDPGPADGVMGPKTAAAIRRYQEDHDLLVDGRPTAELAAHLNRRAEEPDQQAVASEI